MDFEFYIMKLSRRQIRDIAQELDCGMKCYINKETGEVKPMLDFDYMEDDTGLWEKELEEIEKKWKDYVIVEKMPSREAFRVMASFAESRSEKKIRERLIYALNRSRPFNNFRNEVNYHDGLREKWFKHKEEQYIKYVESNLKYEFELEEEKVEKPKEINFNGRTFTLIDNSEGGKVNSETKFEYQQEGNLITADYYGGTIRYGKIIAKLENEKLWMLYHCLTSEDELKAGKAVAHIQLEENGKIRLIAHWEWLDGNGEKGSSEYLED